MDPNIQPGPPPRDPRVQAGAPDYPLSPGAQPRPAAPASFPSVPYRPSGGSPGGGLPVLALTLVTAVAVAVGVGLLRQVFYLVLVFPLAMGFAVGAAGAWAVGLGKVRSPLLAGLFGLLG